MIVCFGRFIVCLCFKPCMNIKIIFILIRVWNRLTEGSDISIMSQPDTVLQNHVRPDMLLLNNGPRQM